MLKLKFRATEHFSQPSQTKSSLTKRTKYQYTAVKKASDKIGVQKMELAS